MISYDIKPNEENLINALEEDALKRNNDLVYFYDLLKSQEGYCSIGLDGRWGSGKTFFVKQEMLIINAMNSVYNIEDEKRHRILDKINLRYNENDQQNSALAVYYDAWQNGNDIDPIQSIIYEILKQTGLQYSFANEKRVIDIATSLIERYSRIDVSYLKNLLNSKDPFDAFKQEKELEEKYREFFSEIMEERGNRLVIFIDELDRCNPAFAVKLLERVKHYLDDDRITVVYSINSYELQHTIKHYYGGDFDGSRYLDRFFDLRMGLPPADLSNWYSKIQCDSGNIIEEVCKRIISYYGFELREISRFYIIQ